MHTRLCLPTGVAVTLILFTLVASLSADVIVLSSGGELRGEIVSDPSLRETSEIQIRTLTGSVVSVSRTDVTTVKRRPIILEQYEVRLRKAPDTLAGQWELAEWCSANQLRDRQQRHLRRVLDFDPEHAEARRLLGYKRIEDRWLTQDEFMSEHGFLKYKGQYRRSKDVEQLLQMEKESEAEKGWYRKVRHWSSLAGDGRATRQADGMTNLLAIRDPNAIPALARILAGDNRENARLLFVAVMVKINHERALPPLVNQSLYDDSFEVRQAAVAAIKKIGPEKALDAYLQALRDESNVTVNRAGYALGELTRQEDFPKVMPQLVNAIITVHRYKAVVPNLNQGPSVSNRGKLRVDGDDLALMWMTGQTPIISSKRWELPPPGFPQPIKVVNVPTEQKNASVHSALKKLSGQEYPLNVIAWRDWWFSESVRKAPKAAANAN